MGIVLKQDRVRVGYYWTPVRSEWQCLDLRGRIAAQSNQGTRALLTVTLSAASGMQSGSEEGRGEGQKRDKYVILVYGFGMTQHSPLFLVQQRKCEAPPFALC